MQLVLQQINSNICRPRIYIGRALWRARGRARMQKAGAKPNKAGCTRPGHPRRQRDAAPAASEIAPTRERRAACGGPTSPAAAAVAEEQAIEKQATETGGEARFFRARHNGAEIEVADDDCGISQQSSLGRSTPQPMRTQSRQRPRDRRTTGGSRRRVPCASTRLWFSGAELPPLLYRQHRHLTQYQPITIDRNKRKLCRLQQGSFHIPHMV